MAALLNLKPLPKIVILLSVYNGEKFLPAQLDSLLAQTYQNFIVLIRDDGSKDQSFELVSAYANSHPDKFLVLPRDGVNYGPSGGFSALMQYALNHSNQLSADPLYLMFCDQDDSWFESKIEVQLTALLAAQQENPAIPLLVHSDLEVVSEQGELIAPSLISFQGLEIQRNSFSNLVISNLVTGCTVMFNQALAEKCMPVPETAIMHDWWLALTAAAFGKLVFLDQPLIHYRQHQNNTIGAKEFTKLTPVSRSFWQKLFATKANEHLIEVGVQADAFKRRFGRELEFRDKVVLFLCAGMKIRLAFVQRVFYRLARRF
ncbi:MAG: glycosyltransferase involved in cell wall biosynthesis [Pseudohongiellaceae bacterium]|jgi:glycosyltransferase involved in cell wall biosynthesis